MVVQRRNAHADLRRHAGHIQRLGVSRVHPPKNGMDLGRMTISAKHCKQRLSPRTAQHAGSDLALDRPIQDRRIDRRAKTFQQPYGCVA